MESGRNGEGMMRVFVSLKIDLKKEQVDNKTDTG